jgi:site-specific DNA-methyltransferase (adenine-specific)
LSASALNVLALGSINQVAGEHIPRSATGSIIDKAEGDVSVIGEHVHIGSDSTNALALRVSKNQIIFGANHFCNIFAANSKGWIVWDKARRGMTFADCELAYTSFNKPARVFDFRWNGALQGYEGKKEKRIHPTQKPVALYEWLLMEYAQPGDRILDTHLGSGSSALAAHNLEFDFVGLEMSDHYYQEAKARLTKHKRKSEIFYYEAANDE